MLYLGTPSGPDVRAAMRDGLLGQMCTPASANRMVEGVPWAADNAVFGKGWPGYSRWWSWLRSRVPYAETCLFAVAPDVVGDHAATLARSLPWLARIRGLGFPVAFVLQDGATADTVPWEQFDVAFIGGSTAWKLSDPVLELAREARRRGKRVHAGRVNSAVRWRHFEPFCDTADGTFLAFGPEANLARLRAWARGYVEEPLPLL